MSKDTLLQTVAASVRDIPLDKLVSSKANIRRGRSAATVRARASSILAHGLLQNLVVRAQRDGQGQFTNVFEVTAGRTRLAALKLLAQRKKIAKDAAIPCNVREDGIAEELSLAENLSREALHPADEFEAFHDLHDRKGQSADEIAARFGTTKRHVQERLKLGAVSPKLLALYRAGEMALDQLMAFAVCDDPARQEEVWAGLSWDKTPGIIRDTLLASHVRARDKRAQFVGLAAYEAAGGTVLRDLFSEGDDGYLADPALLDRLVAEKLEGVAATVRAEGWKWVEIATDFPHGHGFARFYEREVPLSERDAGKVSKLEAWIEEIERALEQDGPDQALEAKLDTLQIKLAAFDAKRSVFDPDAVEKGGAFVVIGHDGEPEVLRGLLRPEDRDAEGSSTKQGRSGDSETVEADGASVTGDANSLSDRLAADLTAHRTMAMRDALTGNPDVALSRAQQAVEYLMGLAADNRA